MQDQKTILPASVLVALYKDTLVLPDEEKKAEIIQNKEEKAVEIPKLKKSVGPLKHLGDHNKKILVIVN